MKKNLIKMLAIFTGILIILAITIIVFVFMNKPNYTEQEMYAADAIKQGLQDNLKDPTSLRVYGDTIYISQLVGSDLTTICLEYDSRNGYGAYNGKKEIEIYSSDDLGWFSLEKGDDYFVDVKSFIELFLLSPEKYDDKAQIGFVDAENVAEILGAEYMG